jgi:hypothetical protein
MTSPAKEQVVKLKFEKYKNEDAYYAINLADRNIFLNSVTEDIEIIQNLRRATNEIILRQAREAGQQVVKVGVGDRPPTAKVMGYATFLSFVRGSSLSELEQKLGFKTGVLQYFGAYIYQVDGLSLNTTNIAPRGNTDWSAGITPRDLFNLSKEGGVAVGNHKDYPAATMPIFQFAILEEVPVVGVPRFIKSSGMV